MPRTLREVVFVDGVRTPFGKAGEKGIYAETRADDLVINCIRELLRRNPDLPPERVDEVAIAATTQIGDQGLTLGRTAALLAGLPKTVPGYSIDRMCAGAMTAVTTSAVGIAFGAYDVVIAGGVEHMGHHPMGEGVDPNPRILSEKLVDPVGAGHGHRPRRTCTTASPSLTKERADAYAVAQPGQAAPRPTPTARSSPTWSPSPTRSRRAGLGPGHRRRAAAPRHHAGGPGGPEDPVPPARPGHRGQRRRPQRRRHRLPARLRGRRRRARACRSGCAWSATPSPASSPRSWASARSRPPRRPCARPG